MADLFITKTLTIDDSELELSAIRAQGAGGQNVNKVATAIHLRFDIKQSSLPEEIKQKLLEQNDSRINSDGIFIVKAQSKRNQEGNKDDAIRRTLQWIRKSIKEDKPRKPTRPSLSAKRKRVDNKKHQGQKKSLRGKVDL